MPGETEPGLPGYGIVEFSASRAIGRNLDVFVGVQNLFDKEYFVGLLPTTIGTPRLVNGGFRVVRAGRAGRMQSDRSQPGCTDAVASMAGACGHAAFWLRSGRLRRPSAAAPSPRSPSLMSSDRARSPYVEQFQRRFGSMVSEERYEQSVQSVRAVARGARAAVRARRAVSDFLLVQVPGEGWTPFRDVFERRRPRSARSRGSPRDAVPRRRVDGRAFDQARRSWTRARATTSAASSATSTSRRCRCCTSRRPIASGFRFERKHDAEDGHGQSSSTRCGGPPISATTGGRDCRRAGRFWVDEATGTDSCARSSTPRTERRGAHQGRLPVRRGAGLWVPTRMEERYRDRRTTDEVRGVATYSRFRKFQVSTSEELVTP